MKKKTLYLTIVMAFIMAMGASAAPVGQTAARDAALQHLVSASASTQLKGGLPTGDLLLLYAEPSDVMTDQAAYYIFNSDDAFVVVAGDDRAGILARGDAPLDMNRISCGLQWMLDMYKGDVDFLLANPMLNVAAQNPGVGTSVAPLLTTEWDQDEPYYNSCPVYQGENCLTGCACTSLAQVMYYWRYANLTSPIEAYTTESLGLRLEELQPTDFDWDNMIGNYYFTSYNDVQAQAVALLMRYVGQAEHMDYAPDGSGTNEQEIADAALKFGYDEGLRRLSKSNFTADQWDALLKTELAAGRPVIYRGQDVNNRGGHSFVIDGYDADGLFHVNFGWSGFGNAYCAMNDFSAYGYTFAFLQGMIIGIQPPEYVEPSIMVAPSSLMLNSHVGNRVSKTFTVKGYALQGSLTLTLDDPTGSYAINKTTITSREAEGLATVQVTFNPATVGVHNASVIISGGGIEPQTVNLSGIATDPTPAIVVDPASLSFEAMVGEPRTATFTVKGMNLTNGLTLELNGDSDAFSIDKSTLSVNQASNIATVTVTYKPTEVGDADASVTIVGGGAEPQTVTLHGTASAPAEPATPGITLDTEQVNFGYGFNGYRELRKLMLTGVGLTGDITLRITGVESVHFNVYPQTITPEAAAQGVEVTLSFFPYSAGQLDASLEITTPGFKTRVVSITGYGVKTGAYLYPSKDSLNFHASVGRTAIMRIGVLKKDFDGWIASPRADSASNVPPIGPIVISPVFAEITGPDADCFDVMSSGLTTSSTGNDSVVFVISYSPLEEGNHTANLVFSTLILNNNHPAHPVTIPLTGVATGDGFAGDLNGDGQLTVSDIILLINEIININRAATDNPAADVNADGEVNITDVVRLIDTVMHSE